MPPAAHRVFVAIGGGHGLSTMLRGLKRYSRDITAIVTMADDGGGSGMLRQDLGMLPPGDARDCVLALANTEPVMERLMTYRFQEGTLEGQNFGNLMMAALNGIYGSFAEAVRQMGQVLGHYRAGCCRSRKRIFTFRRSLRTAPVSLERVPYSITKRPHGSGSAELC